MDSFRPRSFLEYMQLARRRKALILIPALVFSIASAIAIKQLPNVYRSSTFIVVDTPQGSSGAQSPVDLPRRLATVKQQVTTRSRLAGLISKYSLYSGLTNRKVPLDDIIAEMRSDIDVQVSSSRPDATDAFSISYKAKDPGTAQTITAELADQLIAENVRAIASEVSGEADVLQQRSQELAAQLHQMESKAPWLMNVKEDAPLIAAGPGRTGPSIAALRDHRLALGTINDQQYKLEQQIADLDQRIAGQKKIVEGQKKNPLPQDNATYGALIAKRAELQGQRDNLINNQGLTDKHPKVVAISDQIDAINNAIADLQRQQAGQVIQTPEERELAALQTQRDTLKIELEVAVREMKRQQSTPPVVASTAEAVVALPVPRDAESARLAQDYLGLKKTYTDLLSRLQSAQLQEQTVGSGKVERFRILDRANLPEVPVWPNRRLLGLLAAVIGLALGVLIWLAVEARRFTTLQDSKDVEYYTQLPLLASIPQALTVAERRSARRRSRVKFAAVAAFAVVAIFALAKVMMLANLFDLLGRK